MEEGVTVLEAAGHEGPITPQDARTAAQRTRKAAENTNGEVLPKHKRPDHENKDQTQQARAEKNGVSLSQQERLDALARKAPKLHDKVKAGEMSCHAACVKAGIVKVKTPLEIAKRAWARMSAAERRQLLRWLQEYREERPHLRGVRHHPLPLGSWVPGLPEVPGHHPLGAEERTGL
jgi:hypothetical protein